MRVGCRQVLFRPQEAPEGLLSTVPAGEPPKVLPQPPLPTSVFPRQGALSLFGHLSLPDPHSHDSLPPLSPASPQNSVQSALGRAPILLRILPI